MLALNVHCTYDTIKKKEKKKKKKKKRTSNGSNRITRHHTSGHEKKPLVTLRLMSLYIKENTTHKNHTAEFAL